jgi:hypothetical protein
MQRSVRFAAAADRGHWRAFDSRGSRRHRLGSRTVPRIPLPECGFPVTIQDSRPDLQHQMGPRGIQAICGFLQKRLLIT